MWQPVIQILSSLYLLSLWVFQRWEELGGWEQLGVIGSCVLLADAYSAVIIRLSRKIAQDALEG
ncbi:hypothetical protein [Deinococcus frigens]|uniref:hypothetical protein n=1 Tax=Deinococcus frigens TaxID=249403 RepID=UPI0004957C5B|nr:hypothetical protein [Deinococcus frigens]